MSDSSIYVPFLVAYFVIVLRDLKQEVTNILVFHSTLNAGLVLEKSTTANMGFQIDASIRSMRNVSSLNTLCVVALMETILSINCKHLSVNCSIKTSQIVRRGI